MLYITGTEPLMAKRVVNSPGSSAASLLVQWRTRRAGCEPPWGARQVTRKQGSPLKARTSPTGPLPRGRVLLEVAAAGSRAPPLHPGALRPLAGGGRAGCALWLWDFLPRRVSADPPILAVSVVPGSSLAAVLVGTQVTHFKIGSSFKELSSACLATF